jgi:hypothetical protein
MKSNKEWFTLLTPEEQEKFKRNCDHGLCYGYEFDLYMDLNSENFYTFIEGLDAYAEPFDWAYTPQGHDYWLQIANSNRKLNENKEQ